MGRTQATLKIAGEQMAGGTRLLIVLTCCLGKEDVPITSLIMPLGLSAFSFPPNYNFLRL